MVGWLFEETIGFQAITKCGREQEGCEEAQRWLLGYPAQYYYLVLC